METMAVPNDSFSNRWLIPFKPSLDTLHDTPSRETDPIATTTTTTTTTTQSTTTITAPPQQHFNFPSSQPLTLVPADQLFRNGHLLPLYLAPPRKEPPLLPHVSNYPPAPEFTGIDRSHRLRQPSFFQRCRKSSKQIFLMNHWSFLKPLYQKIAKLRTNHYRPRRSCSSSSSWSSSCPSSDVVNASFQGSRRSRTTSKSCTVSLQRNISVGITSNDWRHEDGMSGSDIENSIQSAILHCKKSIGTIDNLELSFKEQVRLGR